MADRTDWSTSQVFVVAPGDKGPPRLPGRAPLLDVTSVEAAVAQLNDGSLKCPEGFCVCYSASAGAYYALYRHDKRAEAHDLFGVSAGVQPDAMSFADPVFRSSGESSRQEAAKTGAAISFGDANAFARRESSSYPRIAAAPVSFGAEEGGLSPAGASPPRAAETPARLPSVLEAAAAEAGSPTAADTLRLAAASEASLAAQRRRIVEVVRRSPDANLAQSICDGIDGLAASKAPVVCVGPTKAGKSTLVNAIFGRLIVPSGALPETVLPVAFAQTEEDNGGLYSIDVTGDAGGCGLWEFLGMQDMQLTRLSSQQTFTKVSELNNKARRLLMAYDDLNVFTELYPNFCLWRLEVLIPQDERLDFTLIDCPGGSEHGIVGQVIKALLQTQVEQAFLALFTIKADNITPIQNPSEVQNFFGGTSQNKDVVLVVNAIENQETRTPAEEFMEAPLSKESLGFLRVSGRFFMSGQVLLAKRLIERLPQKSMMSLVSEAGLDQYQDKFVNPPHNDLSFFQRLPSAEAEKVLREELGLKAGHAKQFIRRGLATAGRLPSWGDEVFEKFREELKVIFKAIYASLEFESGYDVREREQLPELLQSAFESSFADTSNFLEWFQTYISGHWKELLQNYMLDAAVQKSKEGLVRIAHQARLASNSKEQAQQDLALLESRCVKDKMASLAEKIKLRLQHLLSEPTSIEPNSSVNDRIARAVQLFGTKHERFLKYELVRDATDENVANAWHKVVELADMVGKEDLFNKIMNQESQVWGRLIPEKSGAEILVFAFMDWTSKLVTEALRKGGEQAADASAREWLMQEGVAERIDITNWRCEVPELHLPVAVHLIPSTSRKIASKAAGALARPVMQMFSMTGVYCRERVASFTRLTANQYYLGEVPALFSDGVEPLDGKVWHDYAAGIVRAAVDSVAGTSQASVSRLLEESQESLRQRINGGEAELAAAKDREGAMRKVVEDLELMQRGSADLVRA